jgi:uncharacterized membrane protein
MEKFGFTKARVARDRRARIARGAICAAATVVGAAIGWALFDLTGAVGLALVAMTAAHLLAPHPES